MEFKALGDGFGVEVTGFDITEADAGQMADLRRTFHENQFMVIRDQNPSPEAFLKFAEYFGTPQPHILEHLRHADVPAILPLSNIFENGQPIGVFDGAAFWHQDMAYEEIPSNATIVHAIEVPDQRGETLFADMWGAWEALSPSTQSRLAGLVARHRYGNRSDENSQTRNKAMELTPEEQRRVTDVHHPIAMPHQVTGRMGLYGVTATSRGIEGMSDNAARDLLDELAEHCTAERFVQSHSYRVGDIVLWDNFSLMHKATLIDRANGPGTRRYLHRISTK